MASIMFFDSEGSTFVWEGFEENSRKVTQKISQWADHNGFERVAFWQDRKEAHKLYVELNGTKLNYWVHETTFQNGLHDSIEQQMDYARGAHRRVASGYGQFDT